MNIKCACVVTCAPRVTVTSDVKCQQLRLSIVDNGDYGFDQRSGPVAGGAGEGVSGEGHAAMRGLKLATGA